MAFLAINATALRCRCSGQGLAPAERRAIYEASKEGGGVTIVEFDVREWHRKAIDIGRRLEAKGTWDKGLVDQVLALKQLR